MALVDIYEVRVALSMLSKQIYLVFHARRLSGAWDASDIVSGWVETVLPPLQLATVEDLAIDSLYAWSLGDAGDFHEAALDVTGVYEEDPMPPHDACTLRFPRTRRDVHHGYKRIPGLAELYVEDGLITGQQLTRMQDLADALVGNWHNATPEDVCEYVIVKRIKYVDEEDGKTKYRLPETDGELVYYHPESSVVDDAVSTQVSRKL
jgi:hypothetical protein